ncbi:MAG: VWA domain-containing protein, partial [Cytophagales bacterium]|nr:VWA domain-containing protein [Cytophagales bacterium]
LFIISILSTLLGFGQHKGKLETTRLVDVSIIQVIPEKEPVINMVFRAQTNEDGLPVWDLKKEDLVITEDGDTCEIISLEPISINKPINVALVMDHSGSMALGIPSLGEIIRIIRGKSSYVSPLKHAKNSAKEFVSSFNFEKDYISVIGFGSKVTLNTPLSQDSAYLQKQIKDITIRGATAYFDGIVAGIDRLKKHDGVNIVVSMTDGAENKSKNTLDDVINKAKKAKIPVYAVGLGAVQVDTMKTITSATKGEYYHTDNPSELIEVYQKISKQIQSFYAVQYRSKSLQKADREGMTTIDFTNESIYLKNDSENPEVKAYLEKKKFDQMLSDYGMTAVYVLLGIGSITLMYQWRKRRKKRTE